MGRPRSPLTEFILSLPTDMPAKEVVARAIEKGMPCSTSNVPRVRSLGHRSTQKKVAEKTAPARKLAPKKVARSSAASASRASATAMSKSDFIRSQPATASAAEIIQAAKAAGITLDPSLTCVQGTCLPACM